VRLLRRFLEHLTFGRIGSGEWVFRSFEIYVDTTWEIDVNGSKTYIHGVPEDNPEVQIEALPCLAG